MAEPLRNPFALLVLATGVSLLLLLLLGCNGSAQRSGEDGTNGRYPQVALHDVSAEPETDAHARAERDALLKDIRLHLTAMTGAQTGSTHPTLAELERDAQRIREGLQLLYHERDMHGLGWYNAVNDLLWAIERHYAVLEQIRDTLADLERHDPPSAAAEDGSAQ